MNINVAASAVSLLVLGGVSGAQIANNAVQLSAQPTPKISVVAPKDAQPNNQPVQPAPVIVTVNAGDTLSSIADTNSTTYARIFDANDSLSDPNVINPGQQLRIPTNDEQLPDRMASFSTAPANPVVTVANSYAPRKSSYSTASYALPDDAAKAFIYSHESGNNPNSTSPRGCYGLGQDCNGRVQAQCGADYACQDAYFTNYATSRYGSWSAAQAFWQTHGWW